MSEANSSPPWTRPIMLNPAIIATRVVSRPSTSPSRRRMAGLVGMGRITASNPRMSPILNTLDPATLASEMSGRLLNAAVAVTTNSGAEVPKATTVSPMASSDTPNLRATAAADSTIQSAPNQSRKAARTSKAMCVSMGVS